MGLHRDKRKRRANGDSSGDSSSDNSSDGSDGSDGEARGSSRGIMWTIDHRQLRETDLSIATRIAGFAGMQTRDVRGNLSPEVWTQHNAAGQQIGQLLDADSLKSMLMDQLRQQLEDEKALTKEVGAEVVIQFIIKYKKAWEEEYRKDIDRNYDIAQRILSAMEDTVQEVWSVLETSALPPDTVRRRILKDKTSHTLPTDDALVRFYFRNPYTGSIFCRAAGKLLQKKEVCNKAGGYSAKQQRDDITQERDNALIALFDALQDPTDSRMIACAKLLRSEYLHHWVADHKRSP